MFIERTARVYDVAPAEVPDLLTGGQLGSARLNRLKVQSHGVTLAELRELGVRATPIDWYPDGFTFPEARQTVAESALGTNGTVFVQNASSFLPALALTAMPGESIFDACAAPGGKAAHVAALTGNDVELWVNDVDAQRVARLRAVQAVTGFRTMAVTTYPAQYADRFIEARFDRVLLDAVCSGEGLIDMTRSRSMQYWSLARVKRSRRLQTRMLAAAFNLLKPGGTLVYSTCTIAPEENEVPVSTLLRRRTDAVIEPVVLADPACRPGLTAWEGTSLGVELAGALRVVPNAFMEAFFVCRIRKLGGGFTSHDIVGVDLGVEGRRHSGS